MARLVFVDTETTGLDPVDHTIWEVAAIVREDHTADPIHDVEHVFQLQLTERDLALADPEALKINQFHERRLETGLWSLEKFAEVFSYLTLDAHLVGANVSFDAERLRMILNFAEVPIGWSYHLVDTESIVLGYQMARAVKPQFPFRGADLVRQVGLDPTAYPAHTAVGDARMVRDVFDRAYSCYDVREAVGRAS
jgi:DNA polymerase III epsilon subunit-like protein